ncbi:MAG: 4'-phosphopantetheinyl transferase superfamily protein [Bacillota bacterium]|nr:4'-phosphopantetheinyl transferase superfamily protein [Bacillota bacterium]
MKLFIIEDYKSIFPELKGSELTDCLIALCLGDEIVVQREDGGKPFVELDGLNCSAADGASVPHISVSHTGNLFGLLVADCNVGLDIQQRKELDAVKIAARFFSPAEAELVAAALAAGGDNASDLFFSLWTRKEAYAKYTGDGLGQVASGLDVMQLEDVEFRELKLDFAGDGESAEDCFCAVCAERGVDLDEIQISYRK